MKESTLVKMQYDLKLAQQALAVALHKIEKLEQRVGDIQERPESRSED